MADEDRDMFVPATSSNENRFSRWLTQAPGLTMSVGILLALSGCDQLGLDTPAKVESRAMEDSKAIGGACRNAMRAIEDCYILNPKAKKAAVAAGWREMDEYMRENKLEGMAPKLSKKMANVTIDETHADEEIQKESTVKEADKSKPVATEKESLHAEASASQPH